MATEKRIVMGDSLDNTVVVWEKFECDSGCRWTQVKDPLAHMRASISDGMVDGDLCNFSGCRPDHRVHKRGETSDRKEAHDWFRDVHRGVGMPANLMPATLTSANTGDQMRQYED